MVEAFAVKADGRSRTSPASIRLDPHGRCARPNRPNVVASVVSSAASSSDPHYRDAQSIGGGG